MKAMTASVSAGQVWCCSIGHDGADDLVRVHLDEVPGLRTVDAHEQLAGGADVVDVADPTRDEDRYPSERAEARDMEVAAEDSANVRPLQHGAEPMRRRRSRAAASLATGR